MRDEWSHSPPFEGRIDNLYGEGTFYRSFVAEGLSECERIPENER
jgi:hypothetical protein